MWKPQGIFADFMLFQPTIYIGKNAIRGLNTFPGTRIAVISSCSLDEGVKEEIKLVFKKKAVYFITRSWVGEPDIDSLYGSISELERITPDVLIAIGGGSVIDGVKLCRLFYEFPYFELGRTRLVSLPFKTTFIAIPTTVGSGAEASSAAVFITGKHKEMIVSHELQPQVIVLDPLFVKNAPEEIIVSSALDAMGHIIEGYVSLKNNSMADIYAEKAIGILYKELSVDNLDERDYQRMQYAGYLGGIVQNHCIVGAAHAIAHQLSEYGFSHGVAVSLLLSTAIRCNSRDSAVKKRYHVLCSNAGIGNTSNLLKFIEDIIMRSGLYRRKVDLQNILAELVAEDDFLQNIMNDKSGEGNPIPITRGYISELVGAFCNGL